MAIQWINKLDTGIGHHDVGNISISYSIDKTSCFSADIYFYNETKTLFNKKVKIGIDMDRMRLYLVPKNIDAADCYKVYIHNGSQMIKFGIKKYKHNEQTFWKSLRGSYELEYDYNEKMYFINLKHNLLTEGK